MQWSADPNAGFTTAPAAWRPPQPDYRTVNVAAESADSASLLSHYRRLIRLRNEHPELRRGTWDAVECSDPAVYACLRQEAGRAALVLVNLSGRAVDDYRLALAHGPLRGDGGAVELLSGRPVAAPVVEEAGGFAAYTPLLLAPYATAVVALDRP
jgi:glycosidase